MNITSKISIIIPIYNAENYLHRCIDSILNQTFRDFEALLVDDGSPDRSGEICEYYAKQDDRIRVFHKKNGGVSDARQYGLDKAGGEYTIHIDPDDWIEANMLEEMYAKADQEKADMLIVDFYNENPLGQLYVTQKPTKEDCNFVLHDMFDGKLWGSLWNKFIRKSCYEKYNVKFPKDINLWEDLFVCCSLLQNPLKVSYLSKAFYHYDNISNKGSFVRKISLKSIYWQDAFIKSFSNIMTSEELYFRKENTLQRAFAGHVMNGNELRKLYPEINERYIQMHKNDLFHPESLTCSLILRSYPDRLVYVLYKFSDYFVNIYRNLRAKIRM